MPLDAEFRTHDATRYGYFDDTARAYIITDPLPPKPWINYLGNRRLTAFISQQAGGLLWHIEPQSRRISRYHYIPAPPDRPGFYLYVRDRRTGTVWNPHFAPTCTPLDRYACRHAPGMTGFAAEKDGVAVEVTYAIPPADDVMLWKVKVSSVADHPIDVQTVSYLEFGLLEFLREILGWCYLKSQFGLTYDPASHAIRYDYHVFEAPHSPRMIFACTTGVAGFECSRDAFIGRTGSLEHPLALADGHALSDSQLPSGGHGCGTLGVDVQLAPGESREYAYLFALGESWDETDRLLAHYAQPGAVDAALDDVRATWDARFTTLQVDTGDAPVDRFINTWNPYNSAITLELARSISTDHMGTDGLRYRDTTQDALAVANIDPDFSADRMRLVFGQQTRDGGGCFAFSPHNPIPTSDTPHRSDNGVWPIYTMKNLVAETGDESLLDEVIPFRDGGEATVYDHMLLGLDHIYDRRGPNGLPTLFDVDWNDNLAIFRDTAAESVMLGMQLAYSYREFAELARWRGCGDAAVRCERTAAELTVRLNAPKVWDGDWYRRLLLSNGKTLGSAANRQGRIFIEPQCWSVMSGVGDVEDRGRRAMQSAFELLGTDCGLRILDPPFTGIPEPEDPPMGSNPGFNENGSTFCHANTWCIIAEAILGNAERAFQYYRQLLPEVVMERVGADRYGREPYVYTSTILAPISGLFGQAGISWLTGTASWMYIAATHYLLGLRPTLDGLQVRPCLPATLPHVTVTRRYRGCRYEIEIDNARRSSVTLEVDGQAIVGTVLPVIDAERCVVKCWC